MNHSEIIKGKIAKIASNGYVSASKMPDISDKVLNNSIKSIATDIKPEFIVAILDQSIMKNGKEGIVFSGESIYWKTSFEEPQKVLFKDIQTVVSNDREKIKKNGTIVLIPGIKIIMKDESEIILPESTVSNIAADPFIELMNEIITANIEDFSNTNQLVPLQEMSEEIKLLYVKILCNYAFSGDGQIDPKEYAEIISFVVRIEMQSESRISIRQYINDMNGAEELEDLLTELKNSTSQYEFDNISKALVKDILSLFMLENDAEDWKQDHFILGVASELNVNKEQIALFIESIERDNDIIEGRLNDTQITKTLKDLSARAASVGIPMAVLYFSGTAGVSAIGMTSGLAALGMGGVLGFSSMFTGIGALALIGVTSYHGIKKLTGMKDINNNRNREILLQEIMRNTQKSLTYLIEDINTITHMLSEEMTKSDINQAKIAKLSAILKNASKGSKVTVERANYYQSENILVKAPKNIDKNKIFEMTNEPTLIPLREVILSSYEVNEENKLELKNRLSIEQADSLIQSLENIGFYNITDNTTAQIKSSAKNMFQNLKNI
ncbi:hypothetical protein MKY53_06490 [Macrococcus sp. FSL R5-0951]